MRRLLYWLFCALVLRITTQAHALDQYLQVAKIALKPEGASVELRLTPGALVANRIFALIDLDGDGQISSVEEQAYASRVLQDVALNVDGRRSPLALTAFQFPSRQEMNEGVGAIRLNLVAGEALGAASEHQLFFRNDHLPELGVYMVNVMVPAANEFKISGQARDPLQREMRLSFQSVTVDTTWPGRWTGLLMICLCLSLLLPRLKRLRRVLRRRDNM